MTRSNLTWTTRLALLAAVLVGCTTGGDSVTQPHNDTATLPWRLQVNYKAITMKTGDVLQLQTTATTVDGTVVTDLPSVTWTTSDTALKVDASGKLTSSGTVPYGRVFATIRSVSGNWTIADTAQVTISDTVYHFSKYMMWLDGPTRNPLNAWRNYDAVLVDGAGNPLTDAGGDVIYPNTYYWTDAPRSLYSLGTGGGSAHNLGTVKVWASAYMFGVTYRDSVTLTFTYPDTATLYIQRVSYSANPSPSAMTQTDITIVQGGVVKFYNQNSTVNLSLKFDDLASVVNGDIPVVSGYPGSVVTFPNKGKFTYQTSLGFKGTITVVDR